VYFPRNSEHNSPAAASRSSTRLRASKPSSTTPKAVLSLSEALDEQITPQSSQKSTTPGTARQSTESRASAISEYLNEDKLLDIENDVQATVSRTFCLELEDFLHLKQVEQIVKAYQQKESEATCFLHPKLKKSKVGNVYLNYFYFAVMNNEEAVKTLRDEINGKGINEAAIYCSQCCFTSPSTQSEHSVSICWGINLTGRAEKLVDFETRS
jgi:hypothetical protein